MKTFRWIFILMILFLAVIPLSNSYAQDGNPVSDDDVNRLAKEMYCPVCENIPLDVCPTKPCAQWRELIRDKLALGWSDPQIKAFFAEQYGDKVLSLPPRRGFNWLIYVLPPLVLAGGIIILLRTIRRPKPQPVQVSNQPTTKPNAPDAVLDEIEKDLRRNE